MYAKEKNVMEAQLPIYVRSTTFLKCIFCGLLAIYLCPILDVTTSVGETMCHLVQQACEKIDRTRALACARLMSLVHHK